MTKKHQSLIVGGPKSSTYLRRGNANFRLIRIGTHFYYHSPTQYQELVKNAHYNF